MEEKERDEEGFILSLSQREESREMVGQHNKWNRKARENCASTVVQLFKESCECSREGVDPLLVIWMDTHVHLRGRKKGHDYFQVRDYEI